MHMNTEIKKLKLDISMEPAKKKGSQIEKAISAVGNVNTKCGIGGESLLKRHGKDGFKIKL